MRLPVALTELWVVTALATPGASAQSVQFEVADTAGTRWYKENTHAHTLESDGDSPPEHVNGLNVHRVVEPRIFLTSAGR